MATTTNNGWETPDDTDLVKDGALAMRTLGSAIDTSVGTGLLAWQSFAPTMTGWTGAGAWSAAYAKLGKLVFVQARFVPSSTTGIGAPVITLPVNARVSQAQPFLCHIVAGGLNFIGAGRLASTSTFVVYAQNSAATYVSGTNFSSTIPATWAATNDSFAFNFSYEAA